MSSIWRWFAQTPPKPVQVQSGVPLSARSESSKGSTEQDYIPTMVSARERRELKMIELLQNEFCDLKQLQEQCWHGIHNPKLRAETWKILLLYSPTQKSRRDYTLLSKRTEYWKYVNEIYQSIDQDNQLSQQIEKDIPRTRPEFRLFNKERIQLLMKRVLYILGVRNPASSYVQGINELCAPFIAVFLAPFYQIDMKTLEIPDEEPDQEVLREVQADTYWCLSAIFSSMYEFFTPGLPGVIKAMSMMKEILPLIDRELNFYMMEQDVEPVNYAYRWVSCFMMREFPLHLALLIWDSFISDIDGFSVLCVYFSLAIVKKFKEAILKIPFNEIILLLQNLMNFGWTEEDIEVLRAESYYFKCLYGESSVVQTPRRKISRFFTM